MSDNVSRRKFQAKRTPLLEGKTPLAFDNVLQEDLIALTDDQKTDRFIARWMERVDPFKTYPKIFRGSEDKDVLKSIKIFYKKQVLEQQWTEQKYFTVINAILDARGLIRPMPLERFGKMYDNEDLPAQVKERRAKKRLK